jgi:hypothetical protein
LHCGGILAYVNLLLKEWWVETPFSQTKNNNFWMRCAQLGTPQRKIPLHRELGCPSHLRNRHHRRLGYGTSSGWSLPPFRKWGSTGLWVYTYRSYGLYPAEKRKG